MSVTQNYNEFKKLVELYELKCQELEQINDQIQTKLKEVQDATNRKK